MNAVTKTLVISGFYEFGEYVENSTRLLMEKVRNKVIADFKVVRTLSFEATIPDYCRGAVVLEEAARVNASGIICFGMASAVRGFRIETKARNRIDNPKYCPTESGQPVEAEAPIDHVINIDLKPWLLHRVEERMKQIGVPIELSKDAGGFCCNHLMYQILRMQHQLKDRIIPFLFIHIPCCEKSIRNPEEFLASGKVLLPIEKVVEGLGIVLEVAEGIG